MFQFVSFIASDADLGEEMHRLCTVYLLERLLLVGPGAPAELTWLISQKKHFVRVHSYPLLCLRDVSLTLSVFLHGQRVLLNVFQ